MLKAKPCKFWKLIHCFILYCLTKENSGPSPLIDSLVKRFDISIIAGDTEFSHWFFLLLHCRFYVKFYINFFVFLNSASDYDEDMEVLLLVKCKLIPKLPKVLYSSWANINELLYTIFAHTSKAWMREIER